MAEGQSASSGGGGNPQNAVRGGYEQPVTTVTSRSPEAQKGAAKTPEQNKKENVKAQNAVSTAGSGVVWTRDWNGRYYGKNIVREVNSKEEAEAEIDRLIQAMDEIADRNYRLSDGAMYYGGLDQRLLMVQNQIHHLSKKFNVTNPFLSESKYARPRRG